MAEPLLVVENLTCGYGEAVVLSDVSFSLAEGRSLALLGRNGTGKTTLIDTLVGVTRRHAGRILLAGREIQALPVHQRAGAANWQGLGWVPQERNIFKSLTVAENLSAVARPGPWNEARVFQLFPRLEERKKNLGNQLSGGEQQMLAFGRALVLNPKLLLLDEPLEGLAPIIVDELLRAIRRVARDEGLPSIVVEQHPHMVLGVTDDAIVLDRGGIAYRAESEDLLADPAPLDTWLGVAAPH
jgi:branched-chain amino acid transport system ATP-binding protein